MIIFLIGPSGVGKTTLAKSYAEDSKETTIYIDLDSCVAQKHGVSKASEVAKKKGWDVFWRTCEEVIAELNSTYKNSDKLCLVDVGAGALQTEKGCTSFIKNPHTVTIKAPPTDVFKRNILKVTNRDFKEFKNTEYSDERNNVYRSSKPNIIDVSGLKQEKAIEKFKKKFTIILQSLIKKAV